MINNLNIPTSYRPSLNIELDEGSKKILNEFFQKKSNKTQIKKEDIKSELFDPKDLVL